MRRAGLSASLELLVLYSGNRAFVWQFVATMIVAAITCLPLLTHVVNSTDRHIGAVVCASCEDSEVWTTGQQQQQDGVIVAECDHLGRWQPNIPDCVRT